MLDLPEHVMNFSDNNDMPDLNEFMTVQEAAEKLGFNEQSVRHLFRQGTLEGKKIQRVILIFKNSVAAYQKKTQGMNKNDPRRNQSANY